MKRQQTPNRNALARVFVAEKPSVAKAIAAELGDARMAEGFIACRTATVTWCFGHMLELAEPDAYTPDDAARMRSGRKVWRAQDLPIIPTRWILSPKASCRKQLAAIGRLLRQAAVVVHAGDPDREGQLLVEEVLEHFDYRGQVLRFWVSAQDPESVRRGLASLAQNSRYGAMAAAARARQRADWLVGMNLSRAYTLAAARGGSQTLLTVGRVQTPTLALVVGRDRQIERFEARPYFVVKSKLEHRAGTFVGTWQPREGQPGLDSEGRLLDRQLAGELVAAVTAQPATITLYRTERKKQSPPLAFSLADLTVLASQRFGFTAEQTLVTCQRLYELHKLATYPRTDCGYLPLSQHADAPRVLAAIRATAPHLSSWVLAADPQRKSPTWNDAKVSAHHGIVPTMQHGALEHLGEDERALYDLIARRYVAQFYPDHEFLRTNVTAVVAQEAFVATGKLILQAGWREVCDDAERPDAPDGGDLAKAEDQQQLPRMEQGDSAVCREAFAKDAMTRPPPRFTEGSLTRAMEQIHKWVDDLEFKKLLREGDGLGTSATRATILSELRRREFLAPHGKHVISTMLGRALVDVLPDAVTSPVLTALFERVLRDIEQGRASVDDFVSRQAAFVAQRVLEANAGAVTITAAPVPTASHARRTGPTRRSSHRRRRGGAVRAVGIDKAPRSHGERQQTPVMSASAIRNRTKGTTDE